VLGVAKHSETLEELVVYKALYGNGQIWIRPVAMFFGEVDIEGKKFRDLPILLTKIYKEYKSYSTKLTFAF